MGNKKFAMDAKKFLEKELDINFSITKHPNPNIKQILLNGNFQNLKFLRWLYKDATIYIDRKFDLYKNLEKDVMETHSEVVRVDIRSGEKVRFRYGSLAAKESSLCPTVVYTCIRTGSSFQNFKFYREKGIKT